MTDNQRGALFMIAAMGGFALEDMALRTAARDIPIGQAITLFGMTGLGVYALVARCQGTPVVHPAATSRAMILRSLFEICGRLFYSLAIVLIPLSNASAILQATPLFVALGAVLVFAETISPRQWLAIFTGFVGVLMILRPGLAGFEPAAIFAVLGMLGLAARDLATRASPVSMSTAQLGVLGFAMLTCAGIILMLFQDPPRWPTPRAWFWLAAATLIGLGAYTALTRAMRTGEIGTVAPFRYSRLLFGVLIGVGVFHERPDLLTLGGSAIIVASGLVLLAPRKRRYRPT